MVAVGVCVRVVGTSCFFCFKSTAAATVTDEAGWLQRRGVFSVASSHVTNLEQLISRLHRVLTPLPSFYA